MIFMFLSILILGKAEDDWLTLTTISNNVLNGTPKSTSSAELEALKDFYNSLNGNSWYKFKL